MAEDIATAEDEGAALVAAYWREIGRYDQTTMDWRQEGEKIVDLFLDELRTNSTSRRFPMLWANVETLKPAVYARVPVVQCSRRFNDRDPAAKTAAEMMERVANTAFELYKVDEVFRLVRDDRLLPGRGQAWVRYEADFETAADDGGEDYDKLAAEKVCVDYVHWCDFGHAVARTWADVWLVWRRVYKDRESVRKRFGAKIAQALTYSAKSPGDKKTEANKAVIYELWDKRRGKVVWLAKEHPKIIEDSDPPLHLQGFFPCPEPCYATKTSKSLVPIPDYRYYRDQAKEINDLTEKIANLTDWLILKGFVPGGPSAEGGDAVERAVRDLVHNKEVLVTVESWAAFSEKGGASRMIDWLPLDQVVIALKAAIEARRQLIEDVYQITGLSDILRGESDARETLGAQEIKAQTGTRRLRNTRDEIARFTRDIARLVCEVVAEQFQPETLSAMSGYKYMPPPDPAAIQMSQAAPQGAAAMMGPQMGPQMGPAPPMEMPGQGAPPQSVPSQAPPQAPPGQTFDDEVIALLRDDGMRSFRIEIETDSTIQPDEDAEKQRRMEFLQAMGAFVQQALPIVQAAPAMAGMLGEMLMFAVRGFRAGRQLEDVIEQAVGQMTQASRQPPPPDPKMIEAQARMEENKARLQLETQKAQVAEQRDMAKAQADIERDRMKAEADIQIAQMKAEAEIEIAKFKAGLESQIRLSNAAIDHSVKTQAGEAKANGAAVKVNLSDTMGSQIGSAVAQAVVEGIRAGLSELRLNVNMPRMRRVPTYGPDGRIVEAVDEPIIEGTMQ